MLTWQLCMWVISSWKNLGWQHVFATLYTLHAFSRFTVGSCSLQLCCPFSAIINLYPSVTHIIFPACEHSVYQRHNLISLLRKISPRKPSKLQTHSCHCPHLYLTVIVAFSLFCSCNFVSCPLDRVTSCTPCDLFVPLDSQYREKKMSFHRVF